MCRAPHSENLLTKLYFNSLLDQLGWPSLSDRRLNNRLKIFGKTVAGRVAIDTGDLAQPLRQTRYSDLDLSFTALAARIDVYKYSIPFSTNNT